MNEPSAAAGDDELMRRLRGCGEQQGGSGRDESAFETLAGRYREPLRRHIASIVRADPLAADDLLQEVLLRVWTRADTWDGRGAVKAWLFRIATNLALNPLRTLRRRHERSLEGSGSGGTGTA